MQSQLSTVVFAFSHSRVYEFYTMGNIAVIYLNSSVVRIIEFSNSSSRRASSAIMEINNQSAAVHKQLPISLKQLSDSCNLLATEHIPYWE